MPTLPEQPERWRSADLPHGMVRRRDGHYALGLRGQLFRRVPRKKAGRLNEKARSQAIIVRRTCRGHWPSTLEGAAVRDILEPLGFWSYSDVARRVEPWADGDPVCFIARAVKDKGALLTILLRVDER